MAQHAQAVGDEASVALYPYLPLSLQVQPRLPTPTVVEELPKPMPHWLLLPLPPPVAFAPWAAGHEVWVSQSGYPRASHRQHQKSQPHLPPAVQLEPESPVAHGMHSIYPETAIAWPL